MQWKLKTKPDAEQVKSLQKALNIPYENAYLLVQRGIYTFEEARRFFRPQLSDLHNPFLMKDMDTAVSRIEKAIQNNEKILVYGDYDVDGTTAVSIVYSYLKNQHDQVDSYIVIVKVTGCLFRVLNLQSKTTLVWLLPWIAAQKPWIK